MFRRLILSAAAVVSLAAGPVLAQPAPDAGQVSAQPARGAGPMQARLQQVHDKLGITPAQQPQWDAVVAALRENARAMRDTPAWRAERSGDVNAVQRLQDAAELARTRADALQRMIPPVQALYATLSPEQQKTADQTVAAAMHGRRSRG